MANERIRIAAVLLAAAAWMASGCSEEAPTYSRGEFHPPGWEHPSSHGTTTQGIGYSTCFQCHGFDLAGGTSRVACSECHGLSPLQCNFCHGDEAADPDAAYGWAPPIDLSHGAATTRIGVGAHRAHLRNLTLTTPLECEDCHPDVTGIDDPSHLDGSPFAEVVFGARARSDDATPEWDRTTATCSNVYCHGRFDHGNRGNNPRWTDVGHGAAACGTCHGVGEHEPHASAAVGCACHATVISYQNGIYTLDPSKHINGRIDH